MKLQNFLYQLLISPKSSDPDARRQEFILNIILVSLLTGSIGALVTVAVNSLSTSVDHYGNTNFPNLVFISFIGLVLIISRHGYFRIGSLIFIGLLILTTAHLLVAWGYVLQVVVLMEVLIIVVAGILFNAQWGLVVSVTLAILTILFGVLHPTKSFNPDLSWQDDIYMVGDTVGFSVIFLIIGLLTWLSNREITYSFNRARASELALLVERDNLEGKVIERTKQLEETQMTRLAELQRLAEFGRLNANLLHEIGNPLTAAKLNLELAGKDMPNPILQVSNNLKQMERYLVAARHQINETKVSKSFSVDKEIKLTINMMEVQIIKSGVAVTYNGWRGLKLTGDPVKFSQIIRNLLSNSLESYDKVSNVHGKKIDVSVGIANNFIIISVRDFGQGLTKDRIDHIFEPFYTTKTSVQRNMGLGLAMVKRFVEHDFQGTIEVQSNKSNGTLFKVLLKATRK